MLNFLLECNIDENVIKDIENTYYDGVIYNLNCNEYEIVKIIDYFRKIGIEYINELLVFNIKVFLCSFDEIVNRFSKYNIDEIVKSINEDYMTINDILF